MLCDIIFFIFMSLKMKQKKYSPSDLIHFMESPFGSWMDRYALKFPQFSELKDAQGQLANILQQRGLLHEFQLENSFKEQGLSLVKIEGKGDVEKENATLSAMRQGIDVISQACLEMNGFMGYADFLIKVEGTSNLGDFHYEVWDTKLSKHLKPSYIVQLCCYAEMLEVMQGMRPQNIVVVLGSEERKKLRTNDCFQYYLGLKQSFLSSQIDFDPNNIPDPANFKALGTWSTYAEQLLIEKDHLFQIANITRGQIKKINKFGILTVQNLVDTDVQRIPGINESIFQGLKKQAYIQKKSQGQIKPCYQVSIPEKGERQGQT